MEGGHTYTVSLSHCYGAARFHPITGSGAAGASLGKGEFPRGGLMCRAPPRWQGPCGGAVRAGAAWMDGWLRPGPD